MKPMGKWVFLAVAVVVVTAAGFFFLKGMADRDVRQGASPSADSTPLAAATPAVEPTSAVDLPAPNDQVSESPPTAVVDAMSSPPAAIAPSPESADIQADAFLAGVVVDESDAPVTGALVALRSGAAADGEGPEALTATSDADGAFRFDGLPPGAVTLGASAAGFQSHSIESAAPADGVTLRLKRGGAAISGTVFRHPEGTPVEGATVTLRPRSGELPSLAGITNLTAASGGLGEYAFPGLPPGTWLIEAEMPGDSRLGMYPEQRLTVEGLKLSENEQMPGVDIILYEGHTIRGTVTDAVSGDPIEGARVMTTAAREPFAESDADGKYMLSGVRQSSVEMLAEKSGYLPPDERKDVFIMKRPTPLSLERLEVTRDISLMRSTVIEGFVRTADDQPVVGAKVLLIDRSMYGREDESMHRTDRNGAFSIPAPMYSTQRLQARADGWPHGVSDIIEVNDVPVRDVVITLERGAMVSGVVVDSLGDPVDGATVRANVTVPMSASFSMGLDFASGQSGIEGEFEIGPVPEGAASISGWKKGYKNATVKLENLKAGENRDGVRLVLGENHYIAGRIMNEDGEPVKVEMISYSQRPNWTQTITGVVASDGNYRLSNLADAPISIEVFHPLFDRTVADSTTVDRDDFDIVLKPKVETELRGLVVDKATGQPLADFKVDGHVEYDETRPGHFIKRGFTPGYTSYFSITAPGYAQLKAEVAFAKDETHKEQTFEMGPVSMIVGRVLQSAGGEAAPDISVILSEDPFSSGNPSRQSADIKTDDEGRFHFEGLTLGKYAVTIRPAAPHIPINRTVEITEFGQRLDMGDIPLWGGGAIRGKIISAVDDTPLAGEEIALRQLESRLDFTARSATADDAGAFGFDGLPEGRYAVAAVNWSVGAEVELAAGGRESADVVLRADRGTLIVRAVAGETPAPGVIVTMEPAAGGTTVKTTTNQDGLSELKGLAPGEYHVNLRRVVERTSVDIDFSVELAEAETIERSVIFGTGTIKGVVSDAVGLPLRDIAVEAVREDTPPPRDYKHASGGSAESWVGGQFSIGGLEPGLYTVRAESDGVAGEVAGVVVPESGEMPEVELRLGAPEPDRRIRIMTQGER